VGVCNKNYCSSFRTRQYLVSITSPVDAGITCIYY